MPLESRESPRRNYQRTHRDVQDPYRLLSFNERMQRYTPILPSLQEEESADQSSNLEIQERPTTTVMKRETHNYSPYQNGPQVEENTTDTTQLSQATVMTQGVQTNDWITHRLQNHWQQADEPQIIITSDVQLQTDDNEIDDFSILLEETEPNQTADSSPNDFEMSLAQTEVDTNSINNESVPEYVAAYIDVETETYPPNNYDEDHITESYESSDTESVQSDVSENYNASTSDSMELDSTNEAPYKNSVTLTTRQEQYKLYHLLMPVLPTPTYKARQVANSVIKHARNQKILNESDLHCPNCQVFPVLPVTGPCGHTRCTR